MAAHASPQHHLLADAYIGEVHVEGAPSGPLQVRLHVVRRLGTSQGDNDDACQYLCVQVVLCVCIRAAPLCVATLQGLTAVVKDCFAVAGTHCSNGSPAWLATHPAAEQHAAAVQVRQTGRLRA